MATSLLSLGLQLNSVHLTLKFSSVSLAQLLEKLSEIYSFRLREPFLIFKFSSPLLLVMVNLNGNSPVLGKESVKFSPFPKRPVLESRRMTSWHSCISRNKRKPFIFDGSIFLRLFTVWVHWCSFNSKAFSNYRVSLQIHHKTMVRVQLKIEKYSICQNST